MGDVFQILSERIAKSIVAGKIKNQITFAMRIGRSGFRSESRAGLLRITKKISRFFEKRLFWLSKFCGECTPVYLTDKEIGRKAQVEKTMEYKFNKDSAEKKFESFKSCSDEDKREVMENENKIFEILKGDSKLKKFIDDVKTFFSMLKDTFSGAYDGVPVGTIAAIIGSLLYVLSPFDLVPDVIPLIGYLDDAAILALCMNFAKIDVDRYKEWKNG